MGWGGGCKCRHCEVLTIHRFDYQSGRGERSGGLSTAELNVFPARAFLDMAKKHTYTILLNFVGRLRLGWGRAGVGAGVGTGLGMGVRHESTLIYINPH